jgi:hypothetical protein
VAAAPPPPPPANRSRLTVVETVHHSVGDSPVVSSDNRYSRWSTSGAQCVSLKGAAGAGWSALPWDGSGPARALVLRNEAGMRGHAQPPDPALEELKEFVIELGVAASPGQASGVTTFATLGPGESCRLAPTDVGSLRVRCGGGNAPYSLFLVPA